MVNSVSSNIRSIVYFFLGCSLFHVTHAQPQLLGSLTCRTEQHVGGVFNSITPELSFSPSPLVHVHPLFEYLQLNEADVGNTYLISSNADDADFSSFTSLLINTDSDSMHFSIHSGSYSYGFAYQEDSVLTLEPESISSISLRIDEIDFDHSSPIGGTIISTVLVISIHGVAAYDLDKDGLPNWWEEKFFGGITNAIPSEMCANQINTVGQAYIAGLDPHNATHEFSVSMKDEVITFDPCASGRVYSVYWTGSLLEDFQPLETNIPWTCNAYTNATGSADGFFIIGVQLEH